MRTYGTLKQEIYLEPYSNQHEQMMEEGREKGNALFNDTISKCYVLLNNVGYST